MPARAPYTELAFASALNDAGNIGTIVGALTERKTMIGEHFIKTA